MGALADARPIIIICTRERAKSLPFYRDKLGLTLLSEDDFAAVFDIGGEIMRLSTVAGWRPHEHTVLGFKVGDIAKTVRALKAKGVATIVYPGFNQDADGVWTAPGGAVKVAWFNDPDGNNLSLTEFG
jgi:catechol 2,3-dioxygenase-like lactoylglutathione lyase family enzyme